MERNIERNIMPRFTIDVGADLEQQLSDLARTHQVTKAEIIRRAVATYSHIKPELDGEKKLVVVDSDNKVLVKIIVP